MANPTIALTDLVEKGADADLLRQMVQFMAQRLMELDVETLCGAGYDQKIAGTVAEYVVSLALGLPWRPIKPIRGADLPGVEVRSTAHSQGCLILHPSDPDNTAFVLVTGAYPRYTVAGWIVARCGKVDRYWRQQSRPAYFVPQGALHPIETLHHYAQHTKRLHP